MRNLHEEGDAYLESQDKRAYVSLTKEEYIRFLLKANRVAKSFFRNLVGAQRQNYGLIIGWLLQHTAVHWIYAMLKLMATRYTARIALTANHLQFGRPPARNSIPW